MLYAAQESEDFLGGALRRNEQVTIRIWLRRNAGFHRLAFEHYLLTEYLPQRNDPQFEPAAKTLRKGLGSFADAAKSELGDEWPRETLAAYEAMTREEAELAGKIHAGIWGYYSDTLSLKKVQELFEDLLKERPGYAVAHAGIAKAAAARFLKTRDRELFKTAVDHANAALAGTPDHWFVHSAAGSVYRMRGLDETNSLQMREYFTSAIAEFEKSIAGSSPMEHLELNNIGLCYEAIDDIDNALKYLEKAEDVGKSFENYCSLGDLYFKLRNVRQAQFYYDKALKERPNDLETTVNIEKCKLTTEDVFDGLATLQLLVRFHSDSPYAYFALSSFYRDGANWQQAALWLDHYLEKNPDSLQALNNLGHYRFELKEYEISLKHLNRAVELDENFLLARVNRADTLLALGRTTEALADLRAAAKLDPARTTTLTMLAPLEAQFGDSKAANAYFGLLAALNKHDLATYQFIVSACNRAGNADLEEFWAQQARKRFPDELTFVQSLAALNYRRQNWAAAAGHYQWLFERKMDNPTDLLHYAEINSRLGHHDLAVELFKLAATAGAGDESLTRQANEGLAKAQRALDAEAARPATQPDPPKRRSYWLLLVSLGGLLLLLILIRRKSTTPF